MSRLTHKTSYKERWKETRAGRVSLEGNSEKVSVSSTGNSGTEPHNR
jgi:hypothetical protein